MTVVLVISGALLTLAAILLVIRVTIGPTILDRSVAVDVLMSVLVCAIALDAIRGRDTDGLPTLLALAMVGFAGSVAVARYASRVDDVEAESEPGQAAQSGTDQADGREDS